jgi:hypothetical protein
MTLFPPKELELPQGSQDAAGHTGMVRVCVCVFVQCIRRPRRTFGAHRRILFKPHLIRWEEVEEESISGKQFIHPFRDNAGRPIVVMRPRWAGGGDEYVCLLGWGRCVV